MSYLDSYKECLKAIEESEKNALRQIKQFENKNIGFIANDCFKFRDLFDSTKIKNL